MMKSKKHKMSWALTAAAIVGTMAGLTTPAAASNENCPLCQLKAASLDPIFSSSVNNLATLQTGIGVAGTFTPPSPVQLSQRPAAVQTNWDMGQELPGAFHRPWSFSETNFDPSFVTPFYSSSTGMMNVPSAPWNLDFGSARSMAYTQPLTGSQVFDMASMMNLTGPFNPGFVGGL